MIGIYVRLSKNNREESTQSIESQREIILEYIRNDEKLRNEEIREYCDIGYTGGNFKRPNFIKMIKEIKLLKYIIVKDLSRIGRNYIEAGEYIEKIFPENNIKLIAINDENDNEIETGLKNIMNDLYRREIGEKVKKSLEEKRKKSEYGGGIITYGYKMEKGERIKDRAAIEIIRYIFQEYIKGKSGAEIARELNKEEKNVPAEHMRNIYSEKLWRGENNLKKWNGRMVIQILRNEIYKGGIIEEEDFKKAQCRKKNRNKKNIKNKRGKYTGKIICGECNHKMTWIAKEESYYCREYSFAGHKYKKIRENRIEKFINNHKEGLREKEISTILYYDDENIIIEHKQDTVS